MIWTRGSDRNHRRRALASPRAIECLEDRALLADGIAAAPGAAIQSTLGVPITSAVFATYTVSDPTGAPGTQWLAEIQFGDGQIDKHVIPVQVGNQFQIEDSHTYQAPGTYTVKIMIAVPGSHKPNDNLVTTQVAVSMPPSSIGNFAASGLRFRAKANRTFHAPVARFSDPHTSAGQFSTLIFWGDESTPTAGRVRARGRGQFQVVGSHSYPRSGPFNAFITIQDATGHIIAIESTANVRGRK
jgi:hypothetical protein